MKTLQNTPEWRAAGEMKRALARRILKLMGRLDELPVSPTPEDWRRYYAPKLARFQNLHAGEDCFIVGNGPSLNKTDLSKLAGKHVFGLNKIYLMFERQPLDLSYLVAVNPLVIQQAAEQFLKLDIPVFLAKAHAMNHQVFGDNILHVHNVDTVSFSDHMLGHFGVGSTVTYFAMQLAYAMGFQRVFLIGVDHSFKQTGKPNEKQKMNVEDPNHFHPDYFKGHNWQLADLEGSEFAYQSALFHFRRDGREIIDATVGGKLNIFPKMDFDEAADLCMPRKVEPLKI